jgi:hypothetical protein
MHIHEISPTSDQFQGLDPSTWGAQAFLGARLCIPEAGNAMIRGVVKYPIAENGPPIEVVIVAKDFGKRGLKGGGVNELNCFKSTVVPDAYSSISDIQQEEGIEEGGTTLYTWRVKEHGEHGRTSELFLFGNAALRTAETLAVNDDVATRLSDLRTKDMLHASVVLDLQGLGLSATMMENEMETRKRHHVLIVLGVPAGDLNKESTKQAAKALKGTFTVEQKNARTGEITTWLIEIVGVLLEAQPKGTLYAATRKLNGTSALSKQLITIFDLGGGDVYEYEIDLQGGLTAIPKRLGDGTIQIARPLAELVEQQYGIQISEIEAQEALYRKTIWKGGEEISIADLIAQLRPRFANLLTRVNITSRVLTTFIIFTGGGAALLPDEIRAKLEQKARGLKEGEDYLIMPAEIAAVANCVGLFAIGYYKVGQMISKYVEAYVHLLIEQSQVQQQAGNIRHTSRWSEDQQHLAELQQHYQRVSEQIRSHVGQYYPDVLRQVQSSVLETPEMHKNVRR